MIFDVKMEDFCQMAQLVAGGHMTDVLPTPIDGATHIYGDSMSVINNTLQPESVLK